MQSNDREKFVTLIAALAASFGREADLPLFTGYEMGLDDLPIEAIVVGVRRAMRECKFMPSPAGLRELAGVPTTKQRCVLAWEAFDKAVGDHGYYRSVMFDDPIINATVRNLGGWQMVCDKPIDEWQTFFRKEFERVYSVLCATGVSPEQCSPLLGHFAAENVLTGHKVEPPVVVVTGLPPLANAPQIGNHQALIGGSL